VRYDPAQVDMSVFRKAVEGAGYALARQTVEVRIAGMDCAECTQHVQDALAALPGVEAVQVLLSSEKAVLQIDPAQVDLPTIRRAVEEAGYTVPESTSNERTPRTSQSLATFTRPILTLFGLVFGAVLLVVIAGEWLGLFERVTDLVPWYLGWGWSCSRATPSSGMSSKPQPVVKSFRTRS